ncbi:sigma-E factor negative regulatory protein [Solimonas marina]|uniref:Sigma-E factor negative regulatory protein n=1 Tax=Solimonas marina TaxID=2714601 RepID=A0A969W884_9GAMM|nr:sigma-E factor negative regulatory protein [Solimonas marina]NKF21793.1 sigma-E factor negative regulatory protein [Solimonas marina]
MIQETLSALHDGECSDRELDALLAELDRQPELKARWRRMQIARAAQQRVSVTQIDISAAVMAGIGAAPEAANPKVVELASRRRRTVVWRTTGGLAAAASVAAVALTLGMNFGPAGTTGQGAALTAAATGGSPTQASGIHDVAMVSGAAGEEGAIESPAAQMDDDLRNYMIEHSNSLADRGVGGALSYARFAAHTDDEAFAEPTNLTSNGNP